MATWASLAAAPAPAAVPTTVSTSTNETIAVLDANTIIALGVGVRALATVLYTTAGVLNEIRDAKSRQALEAVDIVTGAPSAEALKAVASFAKLTGDLHQLSQEDVHLLALAYTLEVEAHGSEHLRKEPAPVRRSSKVGPRARLPGWGNNGSSDEWDAIDAYEDNDMDLANDEATEVTDDAATSGPGGSLEDEVSAHEESDEPGAGDADDSDGWVVARRSHNAARRAMRKAKRLAERETLATVSEDELADDEEPQSGEEDEEQDSDVRAGADDDVGPPRSGETSSAAEQGDALAREPADSEAPGTPAAFQSNVSLVTADFAMQNVCLQMGLRLVTKNGLRVTKLQRFVLRCEGCSTVCSDTSKLFCPACGHPTLSRVEVSIGLDGANVYGVRRKHVLKGTRYSLPKPSSGRNQPTPILSEDVYRAKVRKPKSKAADDSDPLNIVRFGELKKFQSQPDHIAKGLAHLVTNFRNNPNERKATVRSNRRKR